MAASEVTEKNSDFLKELVNLTYLYVKNFLF